MKIQFRLTIILGSVVACCMLASGAFRESGNLNKIPSLETLAGRALQQLLKTSYRGNGRTISASTLNSWLSKNKLSLSKLPADISGDMRRGSIEALLIPDVANPVLPGTRGEVVFVRSKCLLTAEPCVNRGLLIQPPSFFGRAAEEEECWCENCTGCEGPRNPPECDLYDICICTNHPCSAGCPKCKRCAGC